MTDPELIKTLNAASNMYRIKDPYVALLINIAATRIKEFSNKAEKNEFSKTSG